MKNQEKFTTRSNIKVKVHWVKTLSSYPIRFSTGILFPSLVLFAFCLFIIFLHIRLCEWANDKKKIHPADFRKQDYFLFGLGAYFSISLFLSFSSFLFFCLFTPVKYTTSKIFFNYHYHYYSLYETVKNIKCTI